ncbi:hypothetical protein [Sphingomonas sp. OK281]|uniref:hypothetical protein n=1 Tax=Sphingomonas sp. OK281 TaxID=1881067 RepID=UPI0008E1DD7C|nr:hypothetical protein [Sphingomonas sp. OK281]SFN77164.1 hypothetical protein SAMN05428984_0685 [Sphingomonas sp. OK281]
MTMRFRLDERHDTPYVRPCMNLLLLLSALLSALTGAVPGVRGQSAQAVAQGSVCSQSVAATPAKVLVRPVSGLPTLPHIAVADVLRTIAVVASPLWAERRRE